MNCPVCDNPLDSPICAVCKTDYNSAEFNKLRQFDYLLRATADWTPENLEARRALYADAFSEYREQTFAAKRAAWQAQLSPTETVPSEEPRPATVADKVVVDTPAQRAASPSFEQWLFSENTIKTALYSGAFLLILAGLIFVGANWSRLPGWGKLGVTLATTALMCGAGFALLLRSTTLRIGGLALIAIAAGFAPLNFYVIDEYLADFNETTIWLIGSLICTLFYVWLVRRTQSAILGTFLALGVLSSQMALYAVLNVDDVLLATLLMGLPLSLLLIALRWRTAQEIFRPNYTLAHLIAFFVFTGVTIATLSTDTRYEGAWFESHWWLVGGVIAGAAFYVINFRAIGSQLSEWLAAAAFGLGSITITTHLVNIYIVNRSEVRGDTTALGIAFVVMMAIYLAAGFALPRYRWWLHGTGVLFSMLAARWTWDDPQTATIVLVVVALAYIVAAARYHFEPLILVGLLALYLAVWAFWQISDETVEMELIISYAVLGAGLIGIGRWFRGRTDLTTLLLTGAGGATMIAAFVASVSAENLWLAPSLAAAISIVAVTLTLREKEWLLATTFSRKQRSLTLSGTLTTIAAVTLFVGHFNLMAATSNNPDGAWPLITIALSSAFVLGSWLFRTYPNNELFGHPLNLTGLVTMVVPFSAAFGFDWWVVAVVCAVIGAVTIADGWLRRDLPPRYYQMVVGIGFLIGALWALLAQYGVEEAQWYALPLGMTLLLIGWRERVHDQKVGYLLFTVVGLLVLFGSAFDQSFDNVRYAVLLLIESVIAIAVGVRTRSRAFVQLGLLALIVNGLVQYGPAFANLPRFVQIGLVGSTLLILGLLALFRREQLISARDNLRSEWRDWHV